MQSLRVREGHKVLQAASLSFDASAAEIFPTLLSGAALILVRTSGDLLGGSLFQICTRHAVTHIHLPVPLWHQWIKPYCVKPADTPGFARGFVSRRGTACS